MIQQYYFFRTKESLHEYQFDCLLPTLTALVPDPEKITGDNKLVLVWLAGNTLVNSKLDFGLRLGIEMPALSC